MSLGKELGNPLGNPLGLALSSGAGVKFQQGSSDGQNGSPSVLKFPLRKLDPSKSVVFASTACDPTQSGRLYAMTDFSAESITFTSGLSPENGYWPVVSWLILEIPTIKKITMVRVDIPGGVAQNGIGYFPPGINIKKAMVVPLLLDTNIVNARDLNVIVEVLTPEIFVLRRGLAYVYPGPTSFNCQVVEFE